MESSYAETLNRNFADYSWFTLVDIRIGATICEPAKIVLPVQKFRVDECFLTRKVERSLHTGFHTRSMSLMLRKSSLFLAKTQATAHIKICGYRAVKTNLNAGGLLTPCFSGLCGR